MILFQWIAFGVLGCLLVREVSRNVRGSQRGISGVLRSCLWLSAIICIAWPNLTTAVAELVGIRRGADLVLYVAVLAFLVASLYFYTRQARLQAQLTQVVRHLAIHDAHLGDDSTTSRRVG